jgi:hypothetical protein
MTMVSAEPASILESFPIGDAVTARTVMRPWWRALAADDDVAVRELHHPALVRDPGPGLAARLRNDLGVTVEQCATMGVVNTVSILADRTWAFFCKTGVRSTYERPILSRRKTAGDADAPAARGWLIGVRRSDDGSWRVWGLVSVDETVGKVILPPLIPGPATS